MAPVRIGLIGLSTNPTAWANNAHLPYLKSSPHYKIIALLNSSVESAQAAIQFHQLDPNTTMAYGTPEDLAKDAEVDLVVCSVRVDKHYAAVKPALEAGKDVYVEWPLASDLVHAEELETLAREKGVKTMIGLQGRMDPFFHKLREVIASGKIGKVLSTTVVGATWAPGATVSDQYKYIADRSYGGNMVSIHFAHFIDAFNLALGEFTAFNSLLANQRPVIDVVNDATGNVVEHTVPKTAHDEILIQGTLTSGAVAFVHFRGGKPFPDEPGLRWWIYGSEGEIAITSPRTSLQVGHPDLVAKIYDGKTGEVEEMKTVFEDEESGEFPEGPARNVARMYEAFRKGEKKRYGDFEWAIVRHRMIEEVYKSSEEKREGRYGQ